MLVLPSVVVVEVREREDRPSCQGRVNGETRWRSTRSPAGREDTRQWYKVAYSQTRTHPGLLPPSPPQTSLPAGLSPTKNVSVLQTGLTDHRAAEGEVEIIALGCQEEMKCNFQGSWIPGVRKCRGFLERTTGDSKDWTTCWWSLQFFFDKYEI